MAATKAKMEQAAETKKATKAAGAKVTVTVKQTYYDLQLKEIKHAGETFDVTKERAAELESLKLVEI